MKVENPGRSRPGQRGQKNERGAADGPDQAAPRPGSRGEPVPPAVLSRRGTGRERNGVPGGAARIPGVRRETAAGSAMRDGSGLRAMAPRANPLDRLRDRFSDEAGEREKRDPAQHGRPGAENGPEQVLEHTSGRRNHRFLTAVLLRGCIGSASLLSSPPVSSQRDRGKRLADEVREAVAKTAPAGTPAPLLDSASPEEQAARAALDRARSHAMPSIPASSRLSSAKRAVLRALRFLWREQAAFNALVLDAIDALRESVAKERRGRLLDEEVISRANRAQETWTGGWERRAAIQDGRLAILEAARSAALAAPSGSREPVPAPETTAKQFPPLPPGVYSLFEERFRGSTDEIARKQRFYLPFLAEAPGPVLDVGCGRGEFLRILRNAGIAASGVEMNPIAAAACRDEGLEVAEGDGFADLSSRPAGSLGAVVALQVVEHWPPEGIFAFLREARRVLAPGGLLIAETINTDSLSAWRAFFLDPSHVRPVPPDALRFLAESAGFVDTAIEWLAPVASEVRLSEDSANDAKLNGLLFGPQDYALLARVPPRPEPA